MKKIIKISKSKYGKYEYVMALDRGSAITTYNKDKAIDVKDWSSNMVIQTASGLISAGYYVKFEIIKGEENGN